MHSEQNHLSGNWIVTLSALVSSLPHGNQPSESEILFSGLKVTNFEKSEVGASLMVQLEDSEGWKTRHITGCKSPGSARVCARSFATPLQGGLSRIPGEVSVLGEGSISKAMGFTGVGCS